jgi:hypothetical protein
VWSNADARVGRIRSARTSGGCGPETADQLAAFNRNPRPQSSESAEADPDVMDAYLDLVRYVENKYYIAVSRYTNSGFMRLKLGSELGKRKVSSHVFESGAEARNYLKSSGRPE